LPAAPQAEVLIVDPNRGNRRTSHRSMALLGFELTPPYFCLRPELA
jgi:hypothetical protein